MPEIAHDDRQPSPDEGGGHDWLDRLNEDEFALIAKRLGGYAAAILRGVGGSHATESLVASTLRSAVRRRDAGTLKAPMGDDPYSELLLPILKYKTLTFRRRQWREDQRLSDAPVDGVEAIDDQQLQRESQEIAALVRAAIEQAPLTDQQREVVRLTLQGQSQDEIAATLQVGRSTVQRRWGIALSVMKRYLEERL